MATKVMLQHKQSGLVKPGYYGFSWTYLFFSFLVPGFRGEILIACLHLILTFATGGLWWVLMWFLYNRQYMMRMLESGWVLAGSDAENKMAAASIGLVFHPDASAKNSRLDRP